MLEVGVETVRVLGSPSLSEPIASERNEANAFAITAVTVANRIREKALRERAVSSGRVAKRIPIIPKADPIGLNRVSFALLAEERSAVFSR